MATISRIVAWVLLVVCLLLAAYASIEHGQINKAAAAKVAVVHDTITKDSTVYVHDTARVQPARQVYRRVRAEVIAASGRTGPDTVLKLVHTADTVIAVDSTALAHCARLLQAKDSLSTLLASQSSHQEKRLSYFVEPLYSLTDKAFVVGGGATYHLFGNWSLIGGGVVGPHSTAYAGLDISF